MPVPLELWESVLMHGSRAQPDVCVRAADWLQHTGQPGEQLCVQHAARHSHLYGGRCTRKRARHPNERDDLPGSGRLFEPLRTVPRSPRAGRHARRLQEPIARTDRTTGQVPRRSQIQVPRECARTGPFGSHPAETGGHRVPSRWHCQCAATNTADRRTQRRPRVAGLEQYELGANESESRSVR